ncbi:WD40 repeat domain-containing protein [Streptomyces bacillaris]|uniref:WD40 repeat domain-containing protein n=1 Tax=Streptomyces bacillaris TaxID=68179 RepID=UPI00382506DB
MPGFHRSRPFPPPQPARRPPGVHGAAPCWHPRANTRTGPNELVRVRAAAFSPDGKYLAGVGDDTIFVWDATTGELLTSMRADSDLESVIRHPDSRALFAGGRGLLGYEFTA